MLASKDLKYEGINQHLSSGITDLKCGKKKTLPEFDLSTPCCLSLSYIRVYL